MGLNLANTNVASQVKTPGNKQLVTVSKSELDHDLISPAGNKRQLFLLKPNYTKQLGFLIRPGHSIKLNQINHQSRTE